MGLIRSFQRIVRSNASRGLITHPRQEFAEVTIVKPSDRPEFYKIVQYESADFKIDDSKKETLQEAKIEAKPAYNGLFGNLK